MNQSRKKMMANIVSAKVPSNATRRASWGDIGVRRSSKGGGGSVIIG